MTREKGMGLFRAKQFPAVLLGWLLLPVLFQTCMGFQSGARWAWELGYLVLTVLLYAGLWRGRPEDRGGWWCVLLVPAAGLGAAFCQNALLGGALVLLPVALLARANLPAVPRVMAAAVLAALCAGVALSLAAAALGGTARYLVNDPEGGPGTYAEVTVVDPGAMGRIRYHAVEQTALLDLGPVLRLSYVTGRDSAASGAGKYGAVIDRYFAS